MSLEQIILKNFIPINVFFFRKKIKRTINSEVGGADNTGHFNCVFASVLYFRIENNERVCFKLILKFKFVARENFLKQAITKLV
jgi:hypothetical protein